MRVQVTLKSGSSVTLTGKGLGMLAEMAHTPLGRVLDEEGGWLLLEDDGGLIIEQSIYVYPRGRRPIGVNQPPGGGTNYPFAQPSDDVRYLLGDFYLSYEDNLCAFQQPFHVAWLHGFGDVTAAAPEGYPTPTHDHDLVVKDAAGLVVFDSTAATATEQDWGNGRLRIVEWQTAHQVCRCTWHTGWSLADVAAGLARQYPSHLLPVQAELDPRTLNRLPRRVRSLSVDLQTFTEGKVEFENGYNTTLSLVPASALTTGLARRMARASDIKGLVPGTRLTTQIRLDGIPGSGLGLYPGCGNFDPVVTELGGVQPDASGNVTLDASGCLRSQRPVALVDDAPRTFGYLSTELTPANAQSALQIRNNCAPCCDCAMYVRTYVGLKRQWNLWGDLASSSEVVRDIMIANIARWEAARLCRDAHAVRVVCMPSADCKVVFGALYCNNHTSCAAPLTLRFTGEVSGGDVQAGNCQQCLVGGSSSSIEGEPQALGGAWPVFEVPFDYANPNETSKAGFRVCLGDCTSGMSCRVTVTVHYPDFVNEPTPSVATPYDLQALWGNSGLSTPSSPIRAMAVSDWVPLNPRSAYCSACSCTPATPDVQS